jgi:hypothetical protein
MSLPNRAKREPQAPSDRLAYHGRHGVEMKHVHEKLEFRILMLVRWKVLRRR